MKFLITGGAGFIGSHLAESLLADGHTVTVIDDFSTGSMDNLEAVKDHSGLTVIEENILSGSHLEKCIAAADCVIHLAAAVGVELVVHDPVRTLETNVHGSERVLTFAANGGKRCIIASDSRASLHRKGIKLSSSCRKRCRLKDANSLPLMEQRLS